MREARGCRQSTTLLTVAMDSQKACNQKRGKPPLGKEQCAYCKEGEHWKTERNTLMNEEAQGTPWT